MICSTCGSDHAGGASCDTFVRGARAVRTLLSHQAVALPRPVPLAAMKPPPPSADARVGTTFGSFKAVRRIGRGGMGTVYLGEHAAIGSKVAIKVLHEHLASEPGLVQRFYDEARAVNLIGHENIVSIFDMNVLPPRRYYLVMEYLEGRTLASFARQPQPDEVVLPILLQICDALEAAHQRGIVHRDLKPENVFLVKRNRVDHFVKLMDFGIAKLMAVDPDREQTGAGVVIGTPEYMAPEQCSGEPVDGRADLYAVGVIMYLLATGRLPFSGGGITGLLVAHREQAPRPPRELNPAICDGWSSIILKALAKKPDDRFASAGELACALEDLQKSGKGVQVPAAGAPRSSELTTTPEPVHSRHVATFPTKVVELGTGRSSELTCSDLSRGGMFIASEGALPPVFAKVGVTIALPDGPLECACDVVRHVSVDQAKAWGMSPGFGVQFLDPSPAFKERVDRIVRGLPYTQPPPVKPSNTDDAEAEGVLAFFRKRVGGDHYAILSLPPDADFDQLRSRLRECRNELNALRQRPVSTKQSQQISDLLLRLARAADDLSTPRARARLDSRRGNFVGVARCISAGLTVTGLDALRKDFAAEYGRQLSKAHVHFVTAKAWETQESFATALEEYESALKLDPLNLELQQRYWSLKKRQAPRG